MRFFRQSLRCVCISFAVFTASASAHNVVSGAYVEGMIVEGEVGFSNGESAQGGVIVEIWVGDQKQGETAIEDEGLFSYEAKEAVAHLFKIDLGAGHAAQISVGADEFVGSLSAPSTTAVTVAGAVRTSNTGSANAVAGVSAQQLETIVRRAVAQQIKPLQKELRAYKQKIMFRDIAGGVGFIFGLFGVAAWVAARKDRAASN